MPTKNTLSALIVVLLVIGTSMAVAEEPTSGIAAVLSNKQAKKLELTASTPQDHSKLAVYYREQARKFDERVRYHEDMAEMYRQSPLPFDGKMPVPMQRHCKEWASRFAEQAERAAVLASLHENKALGSTSSASAFEHPGQWGLRSAGFSAPSSGGRTIQASAQQSSLFRESVAAAMRFYDRSKILTYVVSAKGQSLIDTTELRKSAAALFDAQQQFLQSLTEPQKAALGPRIREMQKLQRDVEKGLNELEQDAASPASARYFKAARRIKQSLEKWHVEQHQAGLELGIGMGPS